MINHLKSSPFDIEELNKFFVQLEERGEDYWNELLSNTVNDEAIEVMVDHIQNFYGVEDDDEASLLTQIMLTGFLAGLKMNHK